MPELHLSHTPVARAEMLIRKPVAEVFAAFVDPAITSRFWFSRGSGPLRAGEQIRWDWEMYGHSVPVTVRTLEENTRIVIEWGAYDAPTTVEWVFIARTADTTVVSITNTGFRGTGDEVVKQVLDSTEGFALVLAGLKAYLEHDIILNLVPDRFPDHLVNPPSTSGA